MPAEPETFLPAPSVGEPALDTVGHPADWDHHVHEANVEVVHGSVDDHDWHGGGFIGPDAPGGGGTSVQEKFSHEPHQEGSGKEVREAHHQGYHPHRHQRPEEDSNEDGLLAAAADTSEEGSGKDSGEDDLRENHRKGSSGGRSAPGGMSSEQADHSSDQTNEQNKADWPLHGVKNADGAAHRESAALPSPPASSPSGHAGQGEHKAANYVEAHESIDGDADGTEQAQEPMEASGSEEDDAEWMQDTAPGLPQWEDGDSDASRKQPRSSAILDRHVHQPSCVACDLMIKGNRCGRICGYVCRMCQGSY